MRPKTDGILESSLYVSDLPRSIRFYQDTFGFSVISQRHSGNARVLTYMTYMLLGRYNGRKGFDRQPVGEFLYRSGIHFEQRVKEFIRQL